MSASSSRLMALFDVDEILDLQSFGFRIVSFDRDLRVTVAEEAGHLVQRRAGVEQLRRDEVAPGVRRYLLRDVRLAGQGVHNAPGLRDAQLSTFLRCEDEILIIAAAIGAHLPQRFEESLWQADDALLAPLASNDLHLAALVRRLDVAPAKRQHFGDSPARGIAHFVEQIIPSSRFRPLLGFGRLGEVLRRDQHLHRLRLREGFVALRFGKGGQGDAFAGVEERVADAVGMREQTLDAGKHPDL
jgi:hypothetical protein